MKHWHKRGYIDHVEFDGEYQGCFIADDDSYIVPLETFMRVDGGRYHGISTQTNTSAIGIVIGRDGESAVIQLIG